MCDSYKKKQLSKIFEFQGQTNGTEHVDTQEVTKAFDLDANVNNNNNRGDVLLSRNFLLNPNFKGRASDDKSLTVVSYNILAECHSVPGWRFKQQYKHTSDKHLSNSARHMRLLEELVYLDADIYCLQECPPNYFNNTLKADFDK